ncbi:cytochrome P450 [Pseudonocardia xishanensis]|uniref:Cytochrome P450 n=1 Tax=Pseudonocardia xishanensis TaxID=630995 RepID=A0ABP8S348_9PSEU
MLDVDADVNRLLAGDSRLLADPYPTWNHLRTVAPVLRMGETVILSRHRDVKRLISDNNEYYSRAQNRNSSRFRQARESFSPAGQAAFDRFMDHEYRQVVRMDPPDHPRIRKLMLPPLSMRAIARNMSERVQARVDSMMKSLHAGGSGVVDFKTLSYALSLGVLGDILGINLTEIELIHQWSAVLAEGKLNAESEDKALGADQVYGELMDYIAELLYRAGESAEPSGGLLSALVRAEQADSLSWSELEEMVALLIFAGHETTSNLLTIGVLELLRRPGEWTRLVEEPALIPGAVEELLRFVTPSQFVQQVAVQDHLIDDHEIHRGDTVIGVLAAANRDPQVFDRPDVLDIRRDDAREHLAFGIGPHFCVGANLARMEATMVFRGLIAHFPEPRLAMEELHWSGRLFRSPESLPLIPLPEAVR